MSTQQERFKSYSARVAADGGLLDWEWDDYIRLERQLHPERHIAKEAIRREKEAIGNAIGMIPANLYWLLGKGKNSSSEPLYGAQLLDPETRIVVAEAEADKLSDAIVKAVEKLRR